VERGTPSERQRRIYVCLLDGGEGQFFLGKESIYKKITLKSVDQVYIMGHHRAGLKFIADIDHSQQEEKRGK
jgi:hypothetical protein